MIAKFWRWLARRRQEVRDNSLAQCIGIEEGELIFYLNQPVLQAIQVARYRGERLQIPWRLVASLQKLALFDDGNRIQSGLTFCTYLVNQQDGQQIGSRQGQFVLRTVLSADGDVINQVRRDYLQHPYCLEIVATHHWLINQLLSTLHRRSRQFINGLSWGVAVGVVWLPTLSSAIASLNNNTPPEAIASGFLAVVLPWPAKKMVKRVLMFFSAQITRAALRQTLSRNPFIRNTAQKIWQGFVG
ncbi:MAG: hypothetical protein AB4352_19940 [Hormoscilla sp.]